MRTNLSLRLLLADKDKEIERLKERLSLYESDNDTVIMTGEKWEEIKEENKRLKKELTEEKKAYIKMYNMYVEKEEEIERLHSIIKEVREYIEEMQIWLVDFEDFGITTKGLLEILDKENKE